MATNPIGKNSKTIGVNMPLEIATEIERRAESMHISKSNYCKIILREWMKSGKKLKLTDKG